MSILLKTTEMHTAGEPVRIVESGYPELKGTTLLEKRRFAKEHFDHLRRLLMNEPRGHSDMYGALLVPPDHPDADLAVLFIHNEGYSTMCGHATIALGRYAVDKKLVSQITPPISTVNIQCPCGLVKAYVHHDQDGSARQVRFHSVPSFAFQLDVNVDVEQYGTITLDIGYGGAFYAILPSSRLGLDIHQSSVSKLTEVAKKVTIAVKNQVTLNHPDSSDLAFVYGTIFTDGQDEFSDEPTSNICIFGDGQVDRSPTGSGVSARIALQFARGQISVGQVRRFRSCIGTEFTGKAVKTVQQGNFSSVIVEVEGQAFYIGRCEFTAESNDPLQTGFLVK